MSSEREQDPVYIPYAGPTLLSTSLLNKDTAFTEQERRDFNLTGLIPHHFETIEQQAERAYSQYGSMEKPIDKHIYLRRLQDTNETLFYYLVTQHLVEMLPIIYTPVVGEACERFSEIYRNTRGLFISYPDRDRIDEILHNATKRNVKVIVVTDGSRILGLGDQGVGGMGIPIGKLSLYTACAGISPAYTLPVMLDVGTNNETLLNDPMYLGWHHRRISDDEYDEFVELFINAVKKRWPNALLQFEDFEQRKALPLLEKYQQKICCFNDDIQGTASVTAGSLLAACKVKGEALSQQKFVFVGAGSAGCGIAEQLVAHMCADGLSDEQARERIFMVDRYGLITSDMTGLYDFQQRLAQSKDKLSDWSLDDTEVSLQQVMEYAGATVLVGVSGQPGLFNEILIKTLHANCNRPIIFPLSNPSKRVEAHPQQLIEWTEGKAIIATGSPFDTIEYQGESYPIAQCNNSYIFPGIGLAVMAAEITEITNEMMMVASDILAENSPWVLQQEKQLLPSLANIGDLSKMIAFSVARLAVEQGFAEKMSDEQLNTNIEKHFWTPEYRDYHRVS